MRTRPGGLVKAAWCPEGCSGLSPMPDFLPSSLGASAFLPRTRALCHTPRPGTTGSGGLTALLSGRGRWLCPGLSEGDPESAGEGWTLPCRGWVRRL